MSLCAYCHEHVTFDGIGAWIDATGGDACSGNDELTNENEFHVPYVRLTGRHVEDCDCIVDQDDPRCEAFRDRFHFRYTVTVIAGSKAEADIVIGNRLDWDEEYGFEYRVSWTDA